MKRVLIHSIFYHPELTGVGKYTGDMVEWLVSAGYECTVVTAFPWYPYWKVQPPYTNSFYKKEVKAGGAYTIYRCPLYVPANPSGAKRILQDASFFLTSFLIILRLLFKKKHDYYVAVAPPFHLAMAGLFYRFFKRAKVIYHIQDLQVDMAREMNMIKSPFLLGILEGMEKFILRKVDIVSSISPGMISKIRLKINREIVSFPNWVDTTLFYPIKDKGVLKPKWGFAADDKIVLYSGNLGEKQGIDQILTIAEMFPGTSKIKFVICGTGSYKQKLINIVEQKKLTNVFFFPLQDKDVFNEFLNMADLHLILQKKDASDLVMPSKLTTILAVGGVVIATANPGTSLYDTLAQNRIGIVTEPENDELLYAAIKTNLESDQEGLSQRACDFANKEISLNGVMKKFWNGLDAL